MENFTEIIESGNGLRALLGGHRARRVSLILLDALKARDKNGFLETVCRQYIGAGASVPAVLSTVTGTAEAEEDFLRLGYNFILGLNSAPQEDETKSLIRLRERAKLSQGELAEELGISRAAVSKWERGLGFPTTEKIKKISQVLSCTVEEILSCKPQ